jgi:hypothetical protein
MRLNEELFQSVDGFSGARYTVIVGGGGYFQGVKAVGDFTPQNVVLFFPHGSVDVQGEGLSIKKYIDGDLELSGKILFVTTQLAEKEKGKK